MWKRSFNHFQLFSPSLLSFASLYKLHYIANIITNFETQNDKKISVLQYTNTWETTSNCSYEQRRISFHYQSSIDLIHHFKRTTSQYILKAPRTQKSNKSFTNPRIYRIGFDADVNSHKIEFKFEIRILQLYSFDGLNPILQIPPVAENTIRAETCTETIPSKAGQY